MSHPIVLIHGLWMTPRSWENFSERSVAEAVTSEGAVDLVVGHHAHVVQPIEQINWRWVVFGLGNMLSGMGDSTSCCGARALDGVMVRVDVAEQPDGTPSRIWAR